jgi:hypothetical protein
MRVQAIAGKVIERLIKRLIAVASPVIVEILTLRVSPIQGTVTVIISLLLIFSDHLRYIRPLHYLRSQGVFMSARSARRLRANQFLYKAWNLTPSAGVNVAISIACALWA